MKKSHEGISELTALAIQSLEQKLRHLENMAGGNNMRIIELEERTTKLELRK